MRKVCHAFQRKSCASSSGWPSLRKSKITTTVRGSRQPRLSAQRWPTTWCGAPGCTSLSWSARSGTKWPCLCTKTFALASCERDRKRLRHSSHGISFTKTSVRFQSSANNSSPNLSARHEPFSTANKWPRPTWKKCPSLNSVLNRLQILQPGSGLSNRRPETLHDIKVQRGTGAFVTCTIAGLVTEVRLACCYDAGKVNEPVFSSMITNTTCRMLLCQWFIL